MKGVTPEVIAEVRHRALVAAAERRPQIVARGWRKQHGRSGPDQRPAEQPENKVKKVSHDDPSFSYTQRPAWLRRLSLPQNGLIHIRN